MLCSHISRFLGVSGAALTVFAGIWITFYTLHRHSDCLFFDPQDCFHSNPQARILPRSAENATFEPFLKHYIGVTQLLVTVTAASIAFGGTGQNSSPVAIAKLLLAWSIFFGVMFCALLLWRYEYAQNMKSYTTGWYSAIFAFGFSTLICFMFGYLAWGWGVAR